MFSFKELGSKNILFIYKINKAQFFILFLFLGRGVGVGLDFMDSTIYYATGYNQVLK